MQNVIWISEPKKIGKTLWRISVFEDTESVIPPSVSGQEYFMLGTDRFTMYEYEDFGVWRDCVYHPRYTSHDGTYAGLPKSLKKLFNENEETIRRNLIVENRNLRNL